MTLEGGGSASTLLRTEMKGDWWRKTDRQTERERDRDRERQRQREADRDRQRGRDRERHRMND